jgi:hypothetical protein
MKSRFPGNAWWAVVSMTALSLVAFGCATVEGPLTPEQVFQRAERTLLEAERLEMHFHVESSGAFEAVFDGSIVESIGLLMLEATGTWGGDAVAVSAEATADRLVLNTPAGASSRDRGRGLEDAIIIGLTRMGVLHNLARLVAGNPPDREEGGVRQWVRVEDVEFVAGNQNVLRFGIVVNGSRQGEATLYLDPVSGVPARREQVVRFPGGEMQVLEQYDIQAMR